MERRNGEYQGPKVAWASVLQTKVWSTCGEWPMPWHPTMPASHQPRPSASPSRMHVVTVKPCPLKRYITFPTSEPGKGILHGNRVSADVMS